MSVVSLSGTHIQSLEPCEELVERLEELLQQAKDGYIRQLLYAVVNRDRGVGTGWKGDADHHDCVCGAAMLQYRVMKEL